MVFGWLFGKKKPSNEQGQTPASQPKQNTPAVASNPPAATSGNDKHKSKKKDSDIDEVKII